MSVNPPGFLAYIWLQIIRVDFFISKQIIVPYDNRNSHHYNKSLYNLINPLYNTAEWCKRTTNFFILLFYREQSSFFYCNNGRLVTAPTLLYHFIISTFTPLSHVVLRGWAGASFIISSRTPWAFIILLRTKFVFRKC